MSQLRLLGQSRTIGYSVHSGYSGGTWVSSGTDENTFEGEGHFSSVIPLRGPSNLPANPTCSSALTNLGYSVPTYLFIT